MSTVFYAEAVIGMAITEDKLFIEKPYPNCEHKIPDGAKYCPTCGQLAVKMLSEPAVDLGIKFNHDVYEYMCDWEEALERKGWSIVKTQEDNMIIGIAAKSDDDYGNFTNMVEISNLENLKQQLKDYFEPLGLWDESSFGLWSVMTVSC